MQRLDPECKRLKEQMGMPDITRADRAKLEKEMRVREQNLLPIYHQVAVMFADLHDRAGRMQEKGVITVSFVILCIHGNAQFSICQLLVPIDTAVPDACHCKQLHYEYIGIIETIHTAFKHKNTNFRQ